MSDEKPEQPEARPGLPPAPPPPPPLPTHLKGGGSEGPRGKYTATFESAEPVEPARLPKGFWPGVDYMLHHPREIFESLRRGENLDELSRLFIKISIFMALVYGAVMGATNLLQDSTIELKYKFLFIPIVGIKTPILFLLTLAIVLPPIYVSNAFMGMGYTFRQVVAMLLATIAITTTALASMATVAFFFSLTSRSYHFIKLMHVLFFIYGGALGIGFLDRCLVYRMNHSKKTISTKMLFVWLLLYVFVGTQLAWVLRPFVGSPGEKFEVFRPRNGNFYESVAQSINKMMNE